tara:strand:+ start:729 stop:1475 length:747 start_codon:yes stop_codon:yes gene_type:complete
MQKKFKNYIDCAVVFCGGRGSRLGVIGKKKNKSLLLVKKKPIIYYIVNNLIKINTKKIIFPLGYRGKEIRSYISKEFKKNISQFNFINTGIDSELSIRINKIRKFLPFKGSVLLTNGDTIVDFDLKKFLKSHLKSDKNISLATFNTKVDLGLIQINNKKPKMFKKSIFISDFNLNKNKFEAYSGLIFLKSTFLKNFIFNNKQDFETDMFNKCIKNNNVNLFKIDKGICFPIDNIKNLLYANKYIRFKN